jgi:hypothetical protein
MFEILAPFDTKLSPLYQLSNFGRGRFTCDRGKSLNFLNFLLPSNTSPTSFARLSAYRKRPPKPSPSMLVFDNPHLLQYTAIPELTAPVPEQAILNI